MSSVRGLIDDEFKHQPGKEMGNAAILENATVSIHHFYGIIGFIIDTIIVALCQMALLRKL